jgi:LmbE family N-acetylglucosaminyl deacetylase
MSILVIVAHSDDETIGLGGTIAKHVSEGEQVFGIYLTDGVGSRNKDKMAASQRANAADMAAKELGLEWVGKFNFPDNALDSVPLIDIIRLIEEIKKQINPSMVYTHHFGDLNIDHQIAFQAVMTSFRPQPGESCKEIRTFEVPSATDFGAFSINKVFIPNLFVDIEPYWKVKKTALEFYGEEIHASPHSRSMEGVNILSKYRGVSVGCNRAEAFNLIRKICY